MQNVHVINLRGEKEPFSFRKVFSSARNCGASKEVALAIASQIEKEAFDGISTLEIFDRVFELLLEKSPQSAIRFNLKEGITRLGPTGFPFEKFAASLFEAEGFEIKLNQNIWGYCTVYEIDFIAKKDNLIYIVECKYHHPPGGRVDLQIALANYARFLDIQKGKSLNTNLQYKSLLITNTKFTEKAIEYSRCVGVELLGWKFPPNKGLEFLIEKNKLYPITILPSLHQKLAQELINQKIILVQDVFREKFEKIKISGKERLKREAAILLKNQI